MGRQAVRMLAFPRTIAEGWGYPIPTGCIYFAMAFSVAVEMLNLRVRARRQDAVQLHGKTPGCSGSGAAVLTRGD